MLKMIDEASWQARTWDAAALTAAGIEIVAVKCTEGTGYVNPDYPWQVEQARQAGCAVIHYHVSRYGNATAEAAYFHQHAGTGPGELIANDNEPQYITQLTPAGASIWTGAFTAIARQLFAAPSMTQYSSEYPILNGYLTEVRGKEPLWLAAPGSAPDAPPNVGWLVSFLQYGTREQGGVATDADSAFFHDRPQLEKLAITSPAPAPEPAPAPVPVPVPAPAPEPVPEPAPVPVKLESVITFSDQTTRTIQTWP